MRLLDPAAMRVDLNKLGMPEAEPQPHNADNSRQAITRPTRIPVCQVIPASPCSEKRQVGQVRGRPHLRKGYLRRPIRRPPRPICWDENMSPSQQRHFPCQLPSRAIVGWQYNCHPNPPTPSRYLRFRRRRPTDEQTCGRPGLPASMAREPKLYY